MSFATSPKTLAWLEHLMRTDERVVRHIVVKQRQLTKLPNQHELQQLADKRCAPQRRNASAASQPPGPIAGTPPSHGAPALAPGGTASSLVLVGRRRSGSRRPYACRRTAQRARQP